MSNILDALDFLLKPIVGKRPWANDRVPSTISEKEDLVLDASNS